MERLVALDRSIRAGEYPNSVSFGDRLEVDPRTVQRDVEFLRDRFGAPVVFDRGRNGYAYSDPAFRLSFLDLEEGELIALFLAEGVLKQYGAPRMRPTSPRPAARSPSGSPPDWPGRRPPLTRSASPPPDEGARDRPHPREGHAGSDSAGDPLLFPRRATRGRLS